MKSPLLYFLTSTLSRLDPIYPRNTLPDGADLPARDEAPGHAASGHASAGHHHGGGHHGGDGGSESMGMGPAQYAFFLAVLSGLSLPVGAMLGVKLKPHDTVIAKWIAIGAGALLFAVSVELYGHSIHSFSAGHTELVPMIILLAMSMFGSYLFTYLARLHEGEDEDSDAEEDEERAVCEVKSASSVSSPGKRQRPAALTSSLDVRCASALDLGAPRGAQHLPTLHQANTHGTLPTHYTGRGLGAIVRQIEHHRKWKAQKRWAHLREAMKKYHIITFLQKETEARKRRDGTASRSSTTSFSGKSKDFWENMKKAWGDTNDSGPDPEELSEIASKSRAAAMSMLIMLIVDGIPEGILMGFMSASGTLGPTLVLSLAIANFPEGFAGGQLMEQAGIPFLQIILAWAGPMMLTACGAGIACYMLLWLNPTYTGGHSNPYSIQVLVAATEGVAGGAMISGIAATMLPEAYERRDKKGGILGSGGFLCTFGFLLSFGIKIVLDH